MIIDLHCDTASRMYEARDCAVGLDGLKDAGYDTQCFALFASDAFDRSVGYAEAVRSGALWARQVAQARHFLQSTSRSAHIALARCYDDILSSRALGRPCALLTVEDAAAFCSPHALAEAHDIGVRMATIVWNYKNFAAAPHSAPRDGLTQPGVELARRLEQLGIIIDVSHMSEAGFWDVCRVSRRPFVASHSNARAICDHTRNLHDAQLRAIAAHGGVVGVCYYPPFLGECKSALRAAARHAAHILNVAGEDTPALGSDFDGFDAAQNDLASIADVPRLADALLAEGLSPRQADKVMWRNADRLLRDCL